MTISANNLDFLRREATTDEKGNLHLTRKKYYEFMNNNGITKDILDAVDSARSELTNAVISVANDRLLEKCEADQKDGKSAEDIAKNTQWFTVNTPKGNLKWNVVASKTYSIPNQKDETVTKRVVGKLMINEPGLIDKDMYASYEDRMSALFDSFNK